jgi:hypothetical protein
MRAMVPAPKGAYIGTNTLLRIHLTVGNKCRQQVKITPYDHEK